MVLGLRPAVYNLPFARMDTLYATCCHYCLIVTQAVLDILFLVYEICPFDDITLTLLLDWRTVS